MSLAPFSDIIAPMRRAIVPAALLLVLLAAAWWHRGKKNAQIRDVMADVQQTQNALDATFARTGKYPALSPAIPTTFTGAGGIYYDPESHRVHPNVPGSDASGRAYSTYNELPEWAVRAKKLSARKVPAARR